MQSAPCYTPSDYWSFFALDYRGRRVLDVGSSAGSFTGRSRFTGARMALSDAALVASVDVSARHRPSIVADGHVLPFASESFDIVLANNVIEHLHDPAAGVAEMRRVLKPGGELLFTIPFLYPIHESPHDYTRFTVHGLRRLFRDFAEVDIRERGGVFSTVAQFAFMMTRAADPVRLGGAIRAVLYLPLLGLVQLDRFDRSHAFTRVYYGRLRK
jgi:SAM-dependent methyltransferase